MATTTEATLARSTGSEAQALLSIRNIAKSFGKNPVLRDISLQIAEGEFLTIL
jgi:ABC-type Fe3+/spermidine/putrescine transport system ATPase subunit